MYELGSEHHTDFNANDLARFNNVLMKKKLIYMNHKQVHVNHLNQIQ